MEELNSSDLVIIVSFPMDQLTEAHRTLIEFTALESIDTYGLDDITNAEVIEFDDYKNVINLALKIENTNLIFLINIEEDNRGKMLIKLLKEKELFNRQIKKANAASSYNPYSMETFEEELFTSKVEEEKEESVIPSLYYIYEINSNNIIKQH